MQTVELQRSSINWDVFSEYVKVYQVEAILHLWWKNGI